MKEGLFSRFCAETLVVTAATKLFSLGSDAKLLSIRDPLLNVRYEYLFLVCGLVEIAVAWELWRNATRHRGLCWLFCISMNFILYRTLSFLEGTIMCPCLGTFSSIFRIPPQHLSFLLSAGSIAMFLGSAYFLWRRLRRGGPSSTVETSVLSHRSEGQV